MKEQQEWKIPPCISNWKNPKVCPALLYKTLSIVHFVVPFQGYTIPLDKRLAADGRGLQDHTINDNFAKLAQSLYTADREVRTWFAHHDAVIPCCTLHRLARPLLSGRQWRRRSQTWTGRERKTT